MENQRGVERLIFFTDAVVAIAVTLLILPLVEIVTNDANKVTVEQFIQQNLGQMFAFVLSFVIIARFWIANHGILEFTTGVTPVLMWLDIAWVFTIVVLPLPTEITAVYDASELTTVIYIVNCLVGTMLLTAMSVYLYRHPELEKDDKPTSALEIWGIGSTAAGFIVALVLELIFPRLHYWTLLVLLLATPLDLLVKPRIRKIEARRAPK